MWDAGVYLKFAGERSRPFADLLGRVQRTETRRILDLGCGPGTLTRTLAEHWPGARITGVDNSAEMLAKAAPLAIPGRLEFLQADLATWTPEGPVDLMVSNAALHWVADHARLLERLAGLLAPGGTLAVQMPNRFRSASQFAIEETVADPRWRELEGVGLHRESVQPLLWYAERLLTLGFTVDAWETTYVHVLTGEGAVLEWLKGTGLRPLLERLEGESRAEFQRELGRRLEAVYPPREGVTLFPMPRLFFVATRG